MSQAQKDAFVVVWGFGGNEQRIVKKTHHLRVAATCVGALRKVHQTASWIPVYEQTQRRGSRTLVPMNLCGEVVYIRICSPLANNATAAVDTEERAADALCDLLQNVREDAERQESWAAGAGGGDSASSDEANRCPPRNIHMASEN